jgi:hypothetical protein
MRLDIAVLIPGQRWRSMETRMRMVVHSTISGVVRTAVRGYRRLLVKLKQV